VVAHPEKERRNLSEVPDLLLNVDPEMVVAAQGGDAMALDQLLDELAPYVRRLCAGVAPAAVDDATQEALVAIFRNLHQLRAPEAIVGWARIIAVRAAVAAARDIRRERPLDNLPRHRNHDTSAEGLVDIADALEHMPLEQRAVLVLRQLEGLSEREVADALDLPVGTVKSRLHRARVAFRELWRK
jgi:RNA polymerase sigma factor (sigma-70 family)